MPYLNELYTASCATCGRLATHQPINDHNRPAGEYCKACGARRLKQVLAERDALAGKETKGG